MRGYEVPFFEKSGLKWHFNILFLFCILASLSGSVLFFNFMMKDDFALCLFFGLFMLSLCILFLYIFFSAEVLKRFYIEMTHEGINFSAPFKSKKLFWREIHEAQIYQYNNNTILAILLERDIERKRRRTIINNLNSLLGVPSNSFQISLSLYKNIDPERLLLTIGDQINNSYNNDSSAENKYNEVSENNFLKGIILSGLFCIAVSAVYGLMIYSMGKNYVLIPVIGSFLIISGFNKYYLEESFNIIIRLLLGSLCMAQILLGVVAATLLSNGISFTASNILGVAVQYFTYLITNPLDEIAVILVAFLCFGIGAINGRTSG